MAGRFSVVGVLAVATFVGSFSVREATAQDPVRREKKILKNFSKAIKKADKAAAKDLRIALRPGSKVFPQGTGDQPGEARYDGLRIGDLGISFHNQGTGIVVEQLDPQSALANYGFREQDRILSVGDHPIGDERDFVKYLFAESRRAGRIGVMVLHDDDRVEVIRVEPGVLLEDVEPGFNDPFHRLGVSLGDRAGNDLRVAEVIPQTPAEAAGIRRGDVIIGFDSAKVKSAAELADLLSEAGRGVYVVRVQRDESERKLEVKLP